MNDYRGHLEDCLRNLNDRLSKIYLRGSREATEARRPMAEFCRVQDSTLVRWLYHQDNLPKGETRIRLLCFLEFNGYKVIEFERVPIRSRNFTRLIGYGLLTSEQANEMIGFAQVSQLFQVLRGDHGTTEDREQKLWDVWKSWKDRLDAVVEDAKGKYSLVSNTVGKRTPIESENLSLESPASQSVSGGCPSGGTIHIMRGLLEILDSGVLNNLSSEDWAALRGSSSEILRLSSHLSNLSARLMRPD